MKKIGLIACLIACVQLVGCASITTGQNQTLSVQTLPVNGASCQLSNKDGTWYVPSTPGSVTVDRDYGDLNVNCKKKPYAGVTTVKSKTKPMAFGNLIFGGLVGTAVDMGTGAAYDYPSLITVRMNKANG
ncbi:MAG: hypothetical protein ACHQJ6_06810 [Candidatus Berkiellales bacterium]